MWLDNFFELLYSKGGKKIKEAYELKNQEILEFLYKYKSIDELGHTFDLLEKLIIIMKSQNSSLSVVMN